MKKRFKSKKSQYQILKTVLILIILFIFYFFMSHLVSKINLDIDNETIIFYILDDTNHYMNNKKKNNLFLKTIYKIDISKPITLLQNTSYYIEEKNETKLVYNENYIKDVEAVIKPIEEPLVYIYSTHPTEGFKNTLGINNIEANIKQVSLVLKEQLEKVGIKTIVEESSIPAFLEQNNFNYNQSYQASRYYLEKIKEKYSNIKLFIDLHRDAVDYNISVTSIDNKKYAKIMFVVGLNHSNSKNTLEISNKMNDYLNKNYPSISRGVYINKYGIYNQDFTSNMLLIELGGNNNELEEVLNSVDILTNMIKEYLYEN